MDNVTLVERAVETLNAMSTELITEQVSFDYEELRSKTLSFINSKEVLDNEEEQKFLKDYFESTVREMSIVRNNLMNDPAYTGYCGDEFCLPRTSWSPSNPYGAERWPRTKFNGEQFVCPKCGWTSKYPREFILRYKSKWNK